MLFLNNKKGLLAKIAAVIILSGIVFGFLYVSGVNTKTLMNKASAADILNGPYDFDDPCNGPFSDKEACQAWLDAVDKATAEGKYNIKEQQKDKSLEAKSQNTNVTIPAKTCSIWSDGFACPLFWILDGIGNLFAVKILGGVVVPILNGVLTQTVLINYASLDIVILGSSIAKDLANAFFIFFLLWVAIATIFDIQGYTLRALLPKIIIFALLINFSVPIGNTVINISNSLAKYFVDALSYIPPDKKSQGFLPAMALSQKLVNMTQWTGFVNSGVPDKDTDPIYTPDSAEKEILNTPDCIAGAMSFNPPECEKATVIATEKADKAKALRDDQNWLRFAIVAAIWKIVIVSVLVFVLIAAIFFFIGRMVSLIFLLVLAPMAFLMAILPITREHFNTWWNMLVRQSFFAPAFFFFIFISIETASKLMARFAASGADPWSSSLQYFVTISILLTSLIAAQRTGIAMAGTATAIGNRIVGRAKGYAKRGVMWGPKKAWKKGKEGAAEAYMASDLGKARAGKFGAKWAEDIMYEKAHEKEQRAGRLRRAMQVGEADYGTAAFENARPEDQARAIVNMGKDDIERLEKALGPEKLAKAIALAQSFEDRGVIKGNAASRKLEEYIKNIDLKVAAKKRIAVPGAGEDRAEFKKRKEEYLDEQSAYDIGEMATPKAIENDKELQEYMMTRLNTGDFHHVLKTQKQLDAFTKIAAGDRSRNTKTDIETELAAEEAAMKSGTTTTADENQLGKKVLQVMHQMVRDNPLPNATAFQSDIRRQIEKEYEREMEAFAAGTPTKPSENASGKKAIEIIENTRKSQNISEDQARDRVLNQLSIEAANKKVRAVEEQMKKEAIDTVHSNETLEGFLNSRKNIEKSLEDRFGRANPKVVDALNASPARAALELGRPLRIRGDEVEKMLKDYKKNKWAWGKQVEATEETDSDSPDD